MTCLLACLLLRRRHKYLKRYKRQCRNVQKDKKRNLKLLYDAAMDSLVKLQDSIASELEKKYNESMQNISSAYTSSIRQLEDVSKRYAEMEANAELFEQELKMARTIIVARSFPEGAKQLNPELAVQLADALARFCRAKGINPRTMPPGEIRAKNPSIYFEADLYDLIAWVKRTLENYVVTASAGQRGHIL